MARIPNGILGPFIGKTGPVTGYLKYGENFLKIGKKRKDKKKTPDRTAQRQKITVCNIFTKPFAGSGFFNTTFPAYGGGGSGYNRATSAIMKLAITGKYPDTAIAYPLVLISRGLLPGAVNAAVTVNEDANIVFTWTNNAGTGTAKDEDKVILVATFDGKPGAIFSTNAATRTSGMALLQTSAMKGKVAQTWIGFLTGDEKDASNSVYCGSFTL